MDALGCLPPTTEPRATHHIPDMITLIQRIIANGHAYLVEGGDVFFDVASLPGYGALSGRGQEDNRCVYACMCVHPGATAATTVTSFH